MPWIICTTRKKQKYLAAALPIPAVTPPWFALWFGAISVFQAVYTFHLFVVNIDILFVKALVIWLHMLIDFPCGSAAKTVNWRGGWCEGNGALECTLFAKRHAKIG